MTRVTHISGSAFPALPQRRTRPQGARSAEVEPVEILAPRRPASRSKGQQIAQRLTDRPAAPFLAQYVDQHAPARAASDPARTARQLERAENAYHATDMLSALPRSIRLKDL